MKIKTPKHLLQAHRLICGQDRLLKKEHGKAEFNLLADVRKIFEDRNVVGLGIAEKITNKKRAGELTLCFYVRHKKAKNRLGSQRFIPPVITADGRKPIFTDVYEIGTLKAQANGQNSPIQSGFSVGNDRSMNAGTVGAIVSSGNKHYILSNAHVLAPRGQNAPGIRATYPAPRDNGSAIRRVGTLRHIVSLKNSGNLADAALAEIDANINVDTSIFGLTPPYTVGIAIDGTAVRGSGRTTSQIQGVVKDSHFAGPVFFPTLGTIGFVEQILCIGFSADGDSGSLISASNGQILGILVAGSGSAFAVTPIKNARSELGVNFNFV